MPIFLILVFLFISPAIEALNVPIERVISKAMTKIMKREKIKGATIAVFHKGHEATYSYGFMNEALRKRVSENTLFKIASITKVFTATDLALKVLEDKVLLNSLLTKHLLAIKASRIAPINKVTLQQLATHTSYLPKVAKLSRGTPLQPQSIINFVERWSLRSKQKTPRYRYSNLGYGLLGYALENIERKPYHSLIAEDILLPLHMYSTFFTVPPQEISRQAIGYSQNGKPVASSQKHPMPASGALVSTAADMLKFIKANLQIEGPQKLLRAMALAQKGYFKVNSNFTMGLGWQRVDYKNLLIIEKNGALAGFSSYIGLLSERKIGLAIMVNKSKVNCTKVGRHLLFALDRFRK